MEETNKFLLQRPASQPPPSCPLIPTSRLLFAGLPILEVEGSKILDPEDLPPYPGEEPNWSSYGTYLQDLSVYNSTGINIPQTSSNSPDSERILRSSVSTSDSQRILRSSTSSSTLSLSKVPIKATVKSVPSPTASTPATPTVTKSSIKKSKRSRNHAKRRAYDKAKYQQKMSTEEKRVKMRAKWRYYYNQRKANGKLVHRKRVESEAQKERRRMRWKINKILRKSKRQGQVLSVEETEEEPSLCKIKEKETDERLMLGEREPMKRGRGRPRLKR